MLRFVLVMLMLPFAAQAEERTYGDVYLSGLARESWGYNPPGTSYAMVCNVNGPDGYLSVRSGPGTGYDVRRNLKRLALITVDTSDRHGHWVRVVTADRTHTVNGAVLSDVRDLHVEGYAHDGYLCDFLD